MKAVIKTKPEVGVEIKDVPNPILEDNSVLIKVDAAAICGTDVSMYKYSPGFAGYAKIPVILGHEFSGLVSDTGDDVKEFKIGDRVVSESILYCNECSYCNIKKTNLCTSFKVLGVHLDGAFADYVSVPKNLVHKIPSNISSLEASLLEPLSVVYHATTKRSVVSPGDFAVVIGPGPIGILAAQMLRVRGASEILVTGLEVDTTRLDLAKNLDFNVLVADEDNVEDYVKNMTDGLGADIVIEAAGNPKALSQAFQIVRKGGQITMVGISPKSGEIPSTPAVRKEIRVQGSFVFTWEDLEASIRLLEKRQVETEPLITHKFTLDNAEEALKTALEKRSCKAVITF
jgi:L-iditol 2-dehydrogenase